MKYVNGSIVMEAADVRYTVAEFSFDVFESGIGFLGFGVQFLNETLSFLVGDRVPVHCEIDPVAELDEYDATLVVVVPGSEWVIRLWPIMVTLSKNLSVVAQSDEVGGLVVWGTYEPDGTISEGGESHA